MNFPFGGTSNHDNGNSSSSSDSELENYIFNSSSFSDTYEEEQQAILKLICRNNAIIFKCLEYQHKQVLRDSNKKSKNATSSSPARDLPELPKSSRRHSSSGNGSSDSSAKESTKSRSSRRHHSEETSDGSISSRYVHQLDSTAGSESPARNLPDVPTKSRRKKSKELIDDGSVSRSTRSAKSKGDSTSSRRSIGVKKAKLKRKENETNIHQMKMAKAENELLTELMEKNLEMRKQGIKIKDKEIEVKQRFLAILEAKEENKILFKNLDSIRDPNMREVFRQEQARILKKRVQQHQRQTQPSFVSSDYSHYVNDIGGSGTDLSDY